MYQLFKEQSEKFFKPFSEIANIQVKAFEEVSQKHTDLVSAIWEQSLNFAQQMPQQKNIDDVVQSNQRYFDDIGTKMRTATEESVEIVNLSSKKIGELMQGLLPVDFGGVMPNFEIPMVSPMPSAKASGSKVAASKPAAKPKSNKRAAPKKAGAESKIESQNASSEMESNATT